MEKKPESFRVQNPSGQYGLYVLDSIDRNKKSERRPHRNEVRISQLCLIRTLKMPGFYPAFKTKAEPESSQSICMIAYTGDSVLPTIFNCP